MSQPSAKIQVEPQKKSEAGLIQRKAPITIQKSDSADFDARFVMSAASLDRVRDTIEPKAYSKAATKVDRLIALFNHDYDKIVGYWGNLKAAGDTLTGYIRFFPKDWGAMTKEMLEFGIPLGASIGFQGRAEANKHGGLHFHEIELLETSIVAVPAHPRAQQIAKSFGFDLPDISEIDPEEQPARITQQEIITNAKAAILRANKTMRL